MEHLSNDHEVHPTLHENNPKLYNEKGHSNWIWKKGNGNWDKNMVRLSQWRENHYGTNTNVRRISKYKRADYESYSQRSEFES